MSLFQAREWWAYRPDTDDEVTPGGLAVGNVDNNPSEPERHALNAC